jgi:hypothetical protein
MPRSVDSGRSSRVNPSALDTRRVVWFVGPDASRSSATDVISVGAAVDHLWPRADGTIVCWVAADQHGRSPAPVHTAGETHQDPGVRA